MTTREEKAGPAEPTGAQPETAPGSELSSRAGTGGDAAETAPLTGTVAAPPDDARQLEREIERTREQLGETVQELIARVDVKSRALARATEVSGQLRGRAAAVGTPAWEAMPEQVRHAMTKGAKGARERWLPLVVAAGMAIVASLAVWQWKARSSGATRQASGPAGLVSRDRLAPAGLPFAQGARSSKARGSANTRSPISGSRTSAERSPAGLSRRSGLLCGPSSR